MQALVMTLFLSFQIAGTAASNAPMTVAFDLKQLSAETFAELDGVVLERAVMMRLVQDGFAVVLPQQTPTVLIQVDQEDRALRLVARGPVGIAIASLRLRAQAVAETQLEIAQKAADLARVTTTELPPVVEAPAAPPASRAVEIGLHLGAWWRAHNLDAAMGVVAQIGVHERWLVQCAAEVARSTGIGINVVEAQLGCGPGYRLVDVGPFSVRTTILPGVFFHSFSLDDRSLSARTGVQTDYAIDLAAEAQYRIVDRLVAAVRIEPGMTGHSYAHDALGQQIWRRSMWRLIVGAGIGYQW